MKLMEGTQLSLEHKIVFIEAKDAAEELVKPRDVNIRWLRKRDEYIDWIKNYHEKRDLQTPTGLHDMKIKQLRGMYAGMYEQLEIEKQKISHTLQIYFTETGKEQMKQYSANVNSRQKEKLYNMLDKAYGQ